MDKWAIHTNSNIIVMYIHYVYLFLKLLVKPVVTTPPMSQVSTAMTNVTFTCVANANPQAIIQWSFNGNVLRSMSDTDGTKYYITHEIEGNCSVTDRSSQCETSSTLEIVNTELADSGIYTCNASNAAGAGTVSANLTVIGKWYMHVCMWLLIVAGMFL